MNAWSKHMGEFGTSSIVSDSSNPTGTQNQGEANLEGGPSHNTTPPKNLPGFPDAERIKPRGDSRRWKLPNGDILEWGRSHGGEVERYNPTGKHIGVWSPDGKQIRFQVEQLIQLVLVVSMFLVQRPLEIRWFMAR
jgi:hypothetical protein